MKKIILVLPILAAVVLLQACGQKELASEQAGSFAAAINRSPAAVTPNSYDPLSTGKEANAAVKAPEDRPADEEWKEDKGGVEQPGSGDDTAKAELPVQKPAVQELPVPEAKPIVNAGDGSKAAEPSAAPPKSVAIESPVRSSAEKNVKEGTEQIAANAAPKVEAVVTAEEDKLQAAEETKGTGPAKIGWSEFFDGDDQTTPSDRFWDLSGSTVTIKGFMGEVLSFEKNWFLLIPEPGAECPFDNGDETYWNKIMIVFVPDDVKLRYKSEPLEITGRLDVGIKIDESGYKTMFRLYDASFKEIKS
ncbi:hypothetical protein [Paenibacillus humicus]|uniref:hypothetical protein n=1 Tax=Paenibacillus humicus TaxID=412861 RepID=UPI003D28BA45